MPNKNTTLVTGVASFWGAQVANRLIEWGEAQGDANLHVIGVDAQMPAQEIKGLDFIQADVRNPLMVELLKNEAVQTVCHLAFFESQRLSEASFDLNVMGTMKLLGACAEAGVRKVVLKSSTAVYGASPNNPMFIVEDQPVQGSRAYGYTRDLVEIEAYCNGFRHQAPEVILTILRFANVVGPKVNSPMTRFLKQPLAPTLLGFDPLMQVIHERDAIEALTHVVINDVPGVFNVAAEGDLPLNRVMGLAAKAPLPVFHLFTYWGIGLASSAGIKVGDYFPIEPDYLRYGWVSDLAKMRQEMAFVQRYTAEESLREFAGEQRLRRYMPEAAALAYDEERLRDTLERRRRARTLEASKTEMHDPGMEE